MCNSYRSLDPSYDWSKATPENFEPQAAGIVDQVYYTFGTGWGLGGAGLGWVFGGGGSGAWAGLGLGGGGGADLRSVQWRNVVVP